MITDPLTPLQRPSNLRETVLERLRTAIITGELAEGELYSAPSLGVTLGVSATPVREAMMELAREGLIETVKNKGFRVTSMSGKDLDDLAEIRTLLEAPMMHRVIGRISDETFARLEQLADEIDSAARRENFVDYLRADRALHALILGSSGNEQLTDLVTNLRRRMRLYGLTAVAKVDVLATMSREHRELIGLLRAGDGAGAEALMRRHIGHSRDIWARATATRAAAVDPLTQDSAVTGTPGTP